MSVRRDPDGRWRCRRTVTLSDGSQQRISGTAPKHDNSKAAAEHAEREHIARVMQPSAPTAARKEVPTYEEWFNGRFWKEWVIGERNKPSEQIAKLNIYKVHLGPQLGELRLDAIGVEHVQQLRAKLIAGERADGKGRPLGDKRINNIMAVLSKSLRYAAEVELIEQVPKIRLRKIERPEIEPWSFEDYARILAAAREESPWWYAGACFAGEAGLRVGEVRALDWRKDIDLPGRQIMVQRQRGSAHEGTTKGRKARGLSMTATLYEALTALDVVRTGYVVRNLDGTPMADSPCSSAMYRICRRAGLPMRGWHALRHTFGTHCAIFGANPWMLMEWMGHKRIDETMGYVHVAQRHRSIPPSLVEVGEGIADPVERLLAKLGARAKFLTNSASVAADSSVSTAS